VSCSQREVQDLAPGHARIAQGSTALASPFQDEETRDNEVVVLEKNHRVADDDSQQAQANNPLADLKALNLQNYYISEVTETDEEANQFFVRYAQPVSTPFGEWLVRATVPILKLPTGMDETESGLGDVNVFATYLFDIDTPGVSFGVGPLATIPTGSNDTVGSDQWAFGGAAIYFNAESPIIQFGGLVTYQHKLGGSDRFEDKNILAIQPFGFLQLGNGNYLRAAPIWAFNVETGDHSVPLGIGFGKVIRIENAVLNLFVEPQFSIHDDGPGQPEFQLFTALNIQFYF
jgi:hypothetical protein